MKFTPYFFQSPYLLHACSDYSRPSAVEVHITVEARLREPVASVKSLRWLISFYRQQVVRCEEHLQFNQAPTSVKAYVDV